MEFVFSRYARRGFGGNGVGAVGTGVLIVGLGVRVECGGVGGYDTAVLHGERHVLQGSFFEVGVFGVL